MRATLRHGRVKKATPLVSILLFDSYTHHDKSRVALMAWIISTTAISFTDSSVSDQSVFDMVPARKNYGLSI
jgi:hypothetical protein